MLPFSYKGVERNKIMLAKNTKFIIKAVRLSKFCFRTLENANIPEKK
jgi:hypothetical protein